MDRTERPAGKTDSHRAEVRSGGCLRGTDPPSSDVAHSSLPAGWSAQYCRTIVARGHRAVITRAAPLDPRVNPHQLRHAAVLAALQADGARSLIDLGCGEGRMLEALLRERSFERVTGMDISRRAIERAARGLRLDRTLERQRARISLIQGSLSYRDRREEKDTGSRATARFIPSALQRWMTFDCRDCIRLQVGTSQTDDRAGQFSRGGEEL